MPMQQENLQLCVVLEWGEDEYAIGAPVPEPVTRAGIEQTAINIAGIIAKVLEMRGMIEPAEKQGDV